MHSDEAAVQQANQGFYRAFEALELARMEAAWCHDGQITCVHPGWPLATGWDEVRRTWETIFAHTESIRFEVTDERIDVRGDFAWVVCVEWLGSPGAAREAGTARAGVLATNVFRREAGAWRLVHHHGSSLVPRKGDAPPRPLPARGQFN